MADRPFCLCVAGPNGSGKSTLARALRPQIDSAFWIDPDEVAEAERVRQRAPEVNEDISKAAFRLARNMRVDFAEQRADFAFETVFSHGSNLAFLRALKTLNYEIHLYFVCTEHSDINVSRVRGRVLTGGHDVDERQVRTRYDRSLRLLSLAIRDFDRCFLMDNSQAPIYPAISGGRIIGQTWGDDGGLKSEQVQIYPPIPNWSLRYALFPFSMSWPISEPCQDATDIFAETVHFQVGVGKLLDQFRF